MYLIDDDLVENLPEVRSKNRRVDVVINLNTIATLIVSVMQIRVFNQRAQSDPGRSLEETDENNLIDTYGQT